MIDGQPFFSIIMPVYNGEKYLEKAVNSVLVQSYKNFELILVNDGSKDNSLEVCQKLADNDQRIKVLDLKINKGVNNARNQGLKLIKGLYITYIDSDDSVEKDLLEVGINKIKKFNHPDAVKFGLYEDYYDIDEKLVYSKTVTAKECYLTQKDEIVKRILEWEGLPLFGYIWNSFYKTTCVNNFKTKFVSVSVAGDFLYNIDFFDTVETVLMIEKPMYHYFKRNNDSISSKYVADYFDIYTLKTKILVKLCEKNNLKTNSNMEKIANLYCRYIYSMLERNMSKDSSYNHKEQKGILEEVYNKELFKELIPFAKASSKKEKIMWFLLKHKLTIACFGLTFLIHEVKNKYPIVFNKLK